MKITMGNCDEPEIYLRQGMASGEWRLIIGNRRIVLPDDVLRMVRNGLVWPPLLWFTRNRDRVSVYHLTSNGMEVWFIANQAEDKILQGFVR